MVHLVRFKDGTFAWIKYPEEAKDILNYNEMLAQGLWKYRIQVDEIKLGLSRAVKLDRNVAIFNRGKYFTSIIVE